MILSREQEDALSKVQAWIRAGGGAPFRLFGPAGSGKSSLAQYFAEGVGGPVLFGCFTGKAAHVLKRKGCPNARTIHSLIYRPAGQNTQHVIELEKKLAIEQDILERSRLEKEIREAKKELKDLRFVLNEDSELRNARLLILDECSMVPEKMGRDLVSFGCPILVLGDPAQLPPVKGAGYFTQDEPDVLLETIHRQALESGIIRFATAIRTGEPDWRKRDYGSDVRIVNSREFAEDIRPGIEPPTQVIVGLNNTRRRANTILRENIGHISLLPQVGDRLICLRNNHDRGLLNGAQFTLLSSLPTRAGKLSLEIRDDDGWETTVTAHREHFLGEEIDWKYADEAEHFDFGAAITCHKSQGSEWEDVVVVNEGWKFKPHTRAWRYTAATRAIERLTWVS